MCLAIPMKVVRIDKARGIVESSGVKRTADFSLLTSAKPGDYVLIHAGFAIEKVKPKEARATLKAFRSIGR